MSTKDITKNDLIKSIKAKANKASPLVKRTYFRGLQYKTKPQLKRELSHIKVTREGDINFS